MKKQNFFVCELMLVLCMAAQLSACALTNRAGRPLTNALDRQIKPESGWARGALAAPLAVLGNASLAADFAIRPVTVLPSSMASSGMALYCICEQITQENGYRGEGPLMIYSLVYFPVLLPPTYVYCIFAGSQEEYDSATARAYSEEPEPLLTGFYEDYCIKGIHESYRLPLSPLLVPGAVLVVTVDMLAVLPCEHLIIAGHHPEALWKMDWNRQFVYSCATVPWRIVLAPVVYTVHYLEPSTYMNEKKQDAKHGTQIKIKKPSKVERMIEEFARNAQSEFGVRPRSANTDAPDTTATQPSR